MKKPVIAILASLLLGACMQASDPKTVAQQYWQAMQTGDTATARTLVSADTQTSFDNYIAQPKENKIELNAVALTDSYATVTTIVNSGNTSKQFDTVLVLRNGQWVVDADQTIIPGPPTDAEKRMSEMADKLSDTASKSVEQLQQSLDEGMKMLDELMKEGSKEMSESFNKGMQELNDSLNEALEKLRQRRQQQQQSPEPAQTDSEGLI